MPAPANLVHMQSSTTGTGNLTVAAVNGKQAFGTAFGTGVTTDVFDYFISNQAAAEWERGTGHMSNSTTLVRDTVLESTNSNAAVSFSAGTKDVTNDVPALKQVRTDQVRTKLTANTTFYVRTDGSNSNTGTANTSGGAWLTLQYALDYVEAYIDLAGFSLTIQAGNSGTYAAGITCLGYAFEGGIPTLQGDLTTPSNVVISLASGSCFDLRRGTRLYIGGFKLVSAAEHGIHVSSGSYLGITGKMDYGACSIYHMTADHESTIGISASYNITGGAQAHWNANNNSDIEIVQNSPVITLTGTPAFGTGFATASRGGIIETTATFSGSATGPTYAITVPGYLSTTNTLPGSTTGTWSETLATVGSTFVIGSSTPVAISAVTPSNQTHGTSTNTAANSVSRWSNDTGPARSFLLKSRGATVGTSVIVQNGDVLSEWITYADAGSSVFVNASSIRSTVDGTPGATNDMPTKLELMVTADASGTLGTGLTIRQDKTVEFNGISTTGSAANGFIDNASNNRLLRSTSSLAYKTDIETVDPAIADAFLKTAEPIWYHSLASADKLDDGGMKSFYSFGAEALAKIDPRFVNWGYQPQHFDRVIDYHEEEGPDGPVLMATERLVLKPDAEKVPDGVNDRALIAMLVSVVKRQDARIAALEAKG